MSVRVRTNADFSEVSISIYFRRLNSEIKEGSKDDRCCSSGFCFV